jgi:CHAD domain-containing protein
LYSSAEYTTKVGRNYRTGVRKGDKAPEPAIAILPETSCAAAFSIMLEQVASQIVTHRQIIMESDDERGPHQMRVGLRRLRTLLRALQPAAHFPSIRELDHLAAEVARSVGELRDADVLIGSIYKRVSEATGEPFLEALERALCEHRTSMQHQVRSMLRGRRWRRLQQQLSLPPRQLEGVPDLEQPIKPYATELLSKRWRKLRKIGRNLEKLNVEQRHEMRKALNNSDTSPSSLHPFIREKKMHHRS